MAGMFVVSCAENNENSTAVPDTGTGTIVVSSLTVSSGQEGVVIPIKMTNDTPLRGIVMPLQVRQLDAGAFITSLKLSFGDRLPADGLLNDVQFSNQYFAEDGECKSNKPGGYGTIASTDTLMHDVPGSPVGILFSRQRLVKDDLPNGTDNTGSFIMTVNITGTPGRFEIDTTCANPSNHLLLVKPDNAALIPSFTKGTITIQ